MWCMPGNPWCSEFKTNFFGLKEITKGSDQCTMIQQQYFNDWLLLWCPMSSLSSMNWWLRGQWSTKGEIEHVAKHRCCWNPIWVRVIRAWAQMMKYLMPAVIICSVSFGELCKEPSYAVNWNLTCKLKGWHQRVWMCIQVYEVKVSKKAMISVNPSGLRFLMSAAISYQQINVHCV
jgi:hypothetical protein